MSISEKIGTDIITAMKAHEEHTALPRCGWSSRPCAPKRSTSGEPLTEAEQIAVLSTLLKQRRESVESFTKGNRPELAAKEQTEIEMIEGYMPQAAGEDQLRGIVETAIAHSGGHRW